MNGSSRRRKETGSELEQCRLATTTAAHDGDEFTFTDGE